MPYVQRNEQGVITGIFANQQDGYAEEFLPDGAAEIAEFQQAIATPTAADPVEKLRQFLAANPDVVGILEKGG